MSNSFEEFNLDKSILKSLEYMGYTKPSLVQESVIPKLILREDIVVKSKTGSGKTASFAIPICENVEIEKNYIQALIVVPTRELAIQVHEEISKIGRLKAVRSCAIYGKQPIKEQIRTLKQRVHVVVATPGRIIDHITRGTICVNNLKHFIIDEADKMLNKGFIEDMEFIFNKINKTSTVGLFSATLDNDIKYISNKYLSSSSVINIESNLNNYNKQIKDYIIYLEDKEKVELTKNIIYSQNPKSTIIFCNTKDMVDRVHNNLRKENLLVKKIHGDMSQDKRIFIINDFKEEKFNVLVSTDLSSRGIHIDDISLVINYDVPHDKENYVHRIGRTGRHNKCGKAITIVGKKDRKYIDEIQEYIGYEIEKLRDIEDDNIKYGKEEFIKKSLKSKNNKNTNIKRDKKFNDITRIYLNIGKKKKIRVIDIVGAFNNLEGITSGDIGVIEVEDICSYVDILNNKGDKLLKKYKQIEIKKKLVKIKKDNKRN